VPVELTDVPLLDAAECEAVRGLVAASREAWTSRHPLAPFYTLGAASYLDGEDPPTYRAIAEATNPVLAERFSGLLGRVAAVLEARLGAPVRATGRHALPGFHIFGSHPAFERGVASIHLDRQHLFLDWDEPAASLETLTFTLPIALPASGAGLDAWDVGPEEWLPADPPTRLAKLKALPRRYHPYAAGTLVLHSGNFVHRIAPSQALGPGDERITYHGHGVRQGGTWHLYW
jgi:hypothetical protein